MARKVQSEEFVVNRLYGAILTAEEFNADSVTLGVDEAKRLYNLIAKLKHLPTWEESLKGE